MRDSVSRVDTSASKAGRAAGHRDGNVDESGVVGCGWRTGCKEWRCVPRSGVAIELCGASLQGAATMGACCGQTVIKAATWLQ
jgi:hypothetical protein